MTCLCVTRNRREWLPQAIRCYQAQTYPNRELLVVADGDDVRSLVEDVQDDSIRLIEIEEGYSIGAKRNYGCERAQSPLVAHWDDDDYSAPGRLADQVGRLLDSGKAATGYRSMRFTDGREWWEFRRSDCHAIGTSLVYRREWALAHAFRAIQQGEDYYFVLEAAARGQLSVSDAGDLMYATIHPNNTSARSLTGDSWRKLESVA